MLNVDGLLAGAIAGAMAKAYSLHRPLSLWRTGSMILLTDGEKKNLFAIGP